MSEAPVRLYRVAVHGPAELTFVMAKPAGAQYVQINSRRVKRKSHLCEFFDSYDKARERAIAVAKANLRNAALQLDRAERALAALEAGVETKLEEHTTSY